MDIESLFDLPAELQVMVLLSALETMSVESYRIRQIFNDTGSQVASRFLEEHEHSSARIKDRIMTLFSQK